jgi:hypothetical protein
VPASVSCPVRSSSNSRRGRVSVAHKSFCSERKKCARCMLRAGKSTSVCISNISHPVNSSNV